MKINKGDTLFMDKTEIIFKNKIDKKTIRKACRLQNRFLKKFGDDRNRYYHLTAIDNPVITPVFGVKVLTLSDKPLQKLPDKCIIIGNIRMGFGHYRISMAMASAAHALGYTPLWFDLNSFPETTCTKIISEQNYLYSKGSRLSQKSILFNKFIWERLNSKEFKKLSYDAYAQKTTELMVPLFNDIPEDIPFIATHVWPSQAAVHAGMTHVVNAIPDNWPMALHLSEGAVHIVQTPSAYFGYRMLNGFNKNKILNPMGNTDIVYTGHYIDDELVRNIESDCACRLDRLRSGKPVRFLLSVGGAGAQGDYFAGLIKTLMPYIENGKAVLYLNVGDYRNIWDMFRENIPNIKTLATEHFDNWEKTNAFAQEALTERSPDALVSHGIHVFCHKDIFSAVYTTNVLMRTCDVLITKPSELAFYPVPKLIIRHIGGHEKWGAIRSAEIGDGTPECSEPAYAQSVIQQFIAHPELIENMCKAIISAKKTGIYNGAYHAVELAAGLTGPDGTGSGYTYAGR
jgi:hypothetical protein